MVASAALLDVLVFLAVLGTGHSLLISHLTAFAAGTALYWLLARIESRGWREVAALVAVALLALFMRGGVLGLLTRHLAWSAQWSILGAVAAGLAVAVPGYALVLSRAESPARWRRIAVAIIVYALALRLIYAGSVELLPEETYYWNYAQHLDIGYLDHPPMVAWLIRLGTGMFGNAEFGVRAGALLCGAITGLFAFRLARNLYGGAAGLAALVLSQALPFFFMSGMLMTPDAPMTAAWAASLYFLERALVGGRANAWWGAGVSLGLGLVSKYSIGLLGGAAAAYMLWDAPARRWWMRPEPYGAALIALLVFSPVILWNAQHDWASFAFQTSRRLAEAPRFSSHRLVAAAVVLLTPTGFVAMIRAFTARTASVRVVPGALEARRFMGFAVGVPLAIFLIFSLRHEVKLDWTGAPWTGALPAMAGLFVSAAGGSKLDSWVRSTWTPTLLTLLLIFGAGLHYLVLGLPAVGYSAHIELSPVGWRDFSRLIGARTAAYHALAGDEALIVGMDRYGIASELAFYGRQQTGRPVLTSGPHLFGGIGLMYELWSPAAALEGRTLLLVAEDPNELQTQLVASHAGREGPVVSDVLTRDGWVVRSVYSRLVYDYHSVPVPQSSSH